MNLLKEEENSKIFNKEYSQNESFLSSQNEILESRKFMNILIRSLNSKKNLPPQSLQKECMDILKSCKRDILKIYDEDRNNRTK